MMTFSKYMKLEQLRVIRMLGYTLVLDNFEAWSAFAVVAEVRLTDKERAALAFAALRALSLDQAELVVEAATRGGLAKCSSSFLDTPRGRAALVEWREARDNRRRRAA